VKGRGRKEGEGREGGGKLSQGFWGMDAPALMNTAANYAII